MPQTPARAAEAPLGGGLSGEGVGPAVRPPTAPCTASQLFEDARRAVAEHREACLVLALDGEDWRPGGDGARPGGGPSDASAFAAVMAAEARAARIEAAREAIGRCEESVGLALAVIAGVAAAMPAHGRRCADVLMLRYVDCLGWEAVAAQVGLSVRRCHELRDLAADWVDAVGARRAAEGMGSAEG
ncbi:hypothetical protein HLV35_07460 [Eggerthellaceae bacterium zg-997]|nr:hypothetical protein [Eggerthellaceae bacterium zg-997]